MYTNSAQDIESGREVLLFQDSMFQVPGIPSGARVIFVADMFAEDYVGGAELTSEALIGTCPMPVHKVHSRDVTMQLLQEGADRFWIFGNFTELNPQLLPAIIANLRYSVLEYDYKFCRYRSPEKHFNLTQQVCDCEKQMNGRLVSTFLFGAMGLWWMSEAQKDKYFERFPELLKCNNTVLSSVFSSTTLAYIRSLRAKHEATERQKWLVLGSDSWVKGRDAAEQWCKDNNKDYEVVWNLSYDALLEKLATAQGFVYLPEGSDTCPRMVIEAKLLGCRLVLNDNVQHAAEEWFNTDDIESIERYLLASPGIFWNGIKKMMDYRPSISGYTTTFNCVKQGYPFEQCIKSMLAFCEEVCVVDGGSTDGTLDVLNKLAAEDSRVKVKQVPRNWSHPRFAVFDGMQKAEARAMCTKEFCWQMDSDEVVHELDAPRVGDLARAMPKDALIVALPVIEYWGGPDKVRIDVTPWKWRLSRNDPNITHGVPGDMRVQDTEPVSEGPSYHAQEGTDGCDMIFSDTLARVPFINFYTQEVDNVRKFANLGHSQALQQYNQWINAVVTGLPGVFHYSWYDLGRKIRLYRDYWTKHWNSLYGKDLADTAENNMMFDVPWSQVTDEMIDQLADELKQMGGWVWHRKWDHKTMTPAIVCNRPEPRIMKQ